MSHPGEPVLATERLVLRRLTIEDLDDLAAIYADPQVRRYFPEGTLTYEETREELEWIIDVYYGRYGYGLWATIDKGSGRFIGRCGLLPWKVVPGQDGGRALAGPDEYPDEAGEVEVEVAYLLAADAWGRGLGTEVARAIVAYASEHLGISRLICLPDPENEASRRVAGKAGFIHAGEIEIDAELGPSARSRWTPVRSSGPGCTTTPARLGRSCSS
jgi:ribosomal-protein-alanine N-acetyltransferase